MADIKIVGMVIHTDDENADLSQDNAPAQANAQLLLIGEDGKAYGLETRYTVDGQDWRLAPMDVIEFDENAAPADEGAADQADTETPAVDATADDAADQPPAASFGGQGE